jgi:hypothetical protein
LAAIGVLLYLQGLITRSCGCDALA